MGDEISEQIKSNQIRYKQMKKTHMAVIKHLNDYFPNQLLQLLKLREKILINQSKNSNKGR